MVLTVFFVASTLWGQDGSKKYPWQAYNTSCTATGTFCWFSDEVIASGNHWVSQDKEEKPFEWVTGIRCIQSLHLCILARNQKGLFGSGTVTNVDLYYVKEWSEYQIRAVGESDFPHGKECEIDSLLLNREDASVAMLSVPGPEATAKGCEAILEKPKTVMYKLVK